MTPVCVCVCVRGGGGERERERINIHTHTKKEKFSNNNKKIKAGRNLAIFKQTHGLCPQRAYSLVQEMIFKNNSYAGHNGACL